MSRARDALQRYECLQTVASKALVEKDKVRAQNAPKTKSADDAKVSKVLAALATSIATLDRTVADMTNNQSTRIDTPEKPRHDSETAAHNAEMAALRKELEEQRKVLDHQSGLLAMLATQAVRFEIVRDEHDDITDVIRHPVGANG